MRVIRPGHLYALRTQDGREVELQFFMDPEHNEGDGWNGVIAQEVHRALLDRNEFLDQQAPHWVNKFIQQREREIIALYEARALIRKVEKGELQIDKLRVGDDGHLIFEK